MKGFFIKEWIETKRNFLYYFFLLLTCYVLLLAPIFETDFIREMYNKTYKSVESNKILFVPNLSNDSIIPFYSEKLKGETSRRDVERKFHKKIFTKYDCLVIFEEKFIKGGGFVIKSLFFFITFLFHFKAITILINRIRHQFV